MSLDLLKRQFGTRLKDLRTLAGVSGRAAARGAETDQPSISRIETGQLRPSHPLLERLLALYGADTETREDLHEHLDLIVAWPTTQRRWAARHAHAPASPQTPLVLAHLADTWHDQTAGESTPPLGRAVSAALAATRDLTAAYQHSRRQDVSLLDDAESQLVRALSEIRAARTPVPSDRHESSP
jgi:transcriptional regulator with XRE-family HTH domain